MVAAAAAESFGAQTALVRAVTAMLPLPLVLVEPPGALVANDVQVLPPSPDQKPKPAPVELIAPVPAM